MSLKNMVLNIYLDIQEKCMQKDHVKNMYFGKYKKEFFFPKFAFLS
jgi:hypothetical protein